MQGKREGGERDGRKKRYFTEMNHKTKVEQTLPASIDGSCVIRAVVFNVQTALLRTKESASIIGSAACGVLMGYSR